MDNVSTLPVKKSRRVPAGTVEKASKPARKGKPTKGEESFVEHVMKSVEKDGLIILSFDGTKYDLPKKLDDGVKQSLEDSGNAARFYRDNASALVATFGGIPKDPTQLLNPSALQRDSEDHKNMRKYLVSRYPKLIVAQAELQAWNTQFGSMTPDSRPKSAKDRYSSIKRDLDMYEQVISNAMTRIKTYYIQDLTDEEKKAAGDGGTRTSTAVPVMLDEFIKKLDRIAGAKHSNRSAAEQQMARDAVAALRQVKTGEIQRLWKMDDAARHAEQDKVIASAKLGLQTPTAPVPAQPDQPQQAAA